MPTCAACHHEISIEEPVGRRDECSSCTADLHACRQCRFYDVHAHNQCREPQAEYVSDKEKANFCDYFQFRGKDESSKGEEPEKAKKKLEGLFRK